MKELLERVNDVKWRLPQSSRERMRVDAMIYANSSVLDAVEDEAVKQLTNVACLPGIVSPVIAMPDIHWGYGLPMGAVGAFDAEEGVISAGCTGFDINCGIHMIRTDLSVSDVKSKLKLLMDELFKNVPCGVGSKSSIRLNINTIDDVLSDGARWAVENGYGTKDDLNRMEENGCMSGADPSKVSLKAKKRGAPQLGTLGAGNHFLEVQAVNEVYDAKTAESFGLPEGVTIMVHCGSRGLGHQVATDYLHTMNKAVKKYDIWLPDKQLVCAPTTSPEGQDYFSAMKCAVNFAFTNRLVITQFIRDSLETIFGDAGDTSTVYDVCHNICKLEEHKLGGEKRKLYVHRKGATRSFGPGHPDVPSVYRGSGQPVLIAGSMGTASYVLCGTEKAMDETFGSSCHGAGRLMSRTHAIKTMRGDQIKQELESRGEEIRSTHTKLLAEEAPQAYKDIDMVIESVHAAGISKKVARVVPLGVAKG